MTFSLITGGFIKTMMNGYLLTGSLSHQSSPMVDLGEIEVLATRRNEILVTSTPLRCSRETR